LTTMDVIQKEADCKTIDGEIGSLMLTSLTPLIITDETTRSKLFLISL